MNFNRKNPPKSKIVNNNANKLKYLSIKTLMGSPYSLINNVTSMNLAVLLIDPAKMKRGKLIPNAPALIVKSLNGMGVNPAVNMIMKLYWSYKALMLKNDSRSNPGT